jgi:hypothetical protein
MQPGRGGGPNFRKRFDGCHPLTQEWALSSNGVILRWPGAREKFCALKSKYLKLIINEWQWITIIYRYLHHYQNSIIMN